MIDSADSKTQKLIGKYGDKIFGLNKESRIQIKPELQVEMVGQVKKQIRNG